MSARREKRLRALERRVEALETIAATPVFIHTQGDGKDNGHGLVQLGTALLLLIPLVHFLNKGTGSIVQSGAYCFNFLADADREHCLPPLPLNLGLVCLNKCYSCLLYTSRCV